VKTKIVTFHSSHLKMILTVKKLIKTYLARTVNRQIKWFYYIHQQHQQVKRVSYPIFFTGQTSTTDQH